MTPVNIQMMNFRGAEKRYTKKSGWEEAWFIPPKTTIEAKGWRDLAANVIKKTL